MLVLVLLACGSPEPEVLPTTGGSSMTDALRQAAQSGEPPAARDEGGIPDRLARESDRTTSTTEGADSEACTAAKRARDRHKRRVASVYEKRVRPAEDRYTSAQAALDACLRDLGGCGADPDHYKSIADRKVSTEAAVQRELDGVGKLEAELFPLNQEVSKACGLGRY